MSMSEKKYEQESKKRLSRIVKTNLKTVGVGSLSDIEEVFAEELKDISFNEKFQLVRGKILDRTNQIIRDVEKEICNYSVNWERQKLEFYFKKDNE